MVVLEYMNRYLPIGNVLFKFSRIYYKRCNDCSGYGSSLILIKGCRFIVRAVVAQVVTYNIAYVVECFVVYVVLNFVVLFVSILVVSSCEDTCNTLCKVCCGNTLVDCVYCC